MLTLCLLGIATITLMCYALHEAFTKESRSYFCIHEAGVVAYIFMLLATWHINQMRTFLGLYVILQGIMSLYLFLPNIKKSPYKEAKLLILNILYLLSGLFLLPWNTCVGSDRMFTLTTGIFVVIVSAMLVVRNYIIESRLCKKESSNGYKSGSM